MLEVGLGQPSLPSSYNHSMLLTGVFTPVPTPFDRDGAVDLARFAAALGRWVDSPLTGFVVLGSNGEAPFLDEHETDEVVAAARSAIPRGRPLVVGTGRESTDQTIRATRRAADLGADAVLVRTPGFFKAQMTSGVFIRHYQAVADASSVPVILYNFTAVTGVTIAPAAVSALSRHPNIVGIKESSADVGQLADLVAETPESFAVLSGSARTFHAALCVGASGGILALAALLPEACVRVFELTRAAQHDQARALQRRLMTLARLLGSVYGVPGFKAALNLSGFDVGYPRPPLLPLAPDAVARVRDALHAFQEVPA
jgi:4-hydroxy-2-oxoglutarate aldolase